MIVLFMGAPGAGKGTQADLLVKNCGYWWLSTGDALRKHVREGTPVGKLAKQVMDRGELVSDDILLDILRSELELHGKDAVILDGYPRNLDQARTLGTDFFGHRIEKAVHIDVGQEKLIERLSGRRVCERCGTTYHAQSNPPRKAGVCDQCGGQVIQRADDTAESVTKRLKVYDSVTRPVLDYYKQQGIYERIDGEGDVNKVHKRVQKALELTA